MVLNTKLSSVSHPSPLSASSLLFFLFSPFSSHLVSPLPSHFSKLSCHACSISFLFCLILFLQSSFCTQLLTLIYILFFPFCFSFPLLLLLPLPLTIILSPPAHHVNLLILNFVSCPVLVELGLYSKPRWTIPVLTETKIPQKDVSIMGGGVICPHPP